MAIQTLFGSVEQEPNLLERLKAGIEKTRAGFVDRLEDVLAGRKEIDADLLDELEYTLITADIGVKTTQEILDEIRQRVDRNAVGDAATGERADPRTSARGPAGDRAAHAARRRAARRDPGGRRERRRQDHHHRQAGTAFQDRRPQRAARGRDTFRAAAIEQLEVWAERTDTPIIRTKPGADPSAVVFDALQAAKARKMDYVIVDTAGRLHTKENLMAELEKMRRTTQKVIPDAPHEVLLVIDATTGQNGLEQARKFTESSGVTGIVLTKLDGTAKGGVVVAISRELDLPIRYVGVGEKVDDLLPFDAETT